MYWRNCLVIYIPTHLGVWFLDTIRGRLLCYDVQLSETVASGGNDQTNYIPTSAAISVPYLALSLAVEANSKWLNSYLRGLE